MEREALNDHFEDAPRARLQHPTSEPKPFKQHYEQHDKLDNDTDYDKSQHKSDDKSAWKTSCVRSVHRLDVLRRHGRGMRLKAGRDGSPSELQPFFVSDNFLTAAHFFGDHRDNTDAMITTTGTTTATSSTPAAQ